jgi:hypothetical protein
MPYKDEEWHVLLVKHRIDKMFFSIMDVELFENVYSKKMKLNPFDKAPLFNFKSTPLMWVQSAILKTLVPKESFLDTHYRFNRVGNMAGLKGVIDTSKVFSFLQDRAPHVIAMVCTTHTLKGTLAVWKGLDWESLITSLLKVKVIFKAIICICD